MRVLIAAAGTAGHINPAISIANIIKEKEKNSKILFLGTTRGLENDLVPRAGYELKTISAYGLSKKISIDNIRKMRKTVKGIFEAKKIVEEFKPDIVIGTGGYICGAAVMAASAYKIPILLHESNAFPGKAVKIAARKTNTILVSFKDAIKRIPYCKNVVYTGTPVKIKKRDFKPSEKLEIIKSIGLNDTKPIVLFFSEVTFGSILFLGYLGLVSSSDKLSIKLLVIISSPPKLLAMSLFFLFLNLCLFSFEYKISSKV